MKVWACWTNWYTRYEKTDEFGDFAMCTGDDVPDLWWISTDESKARQWEAEHNAKAWKQWSKKYEGDDDMEDKVISKPEDMHFAHVRAYELDKWVNAKQI